MNKVLNIFVAGSKSLERERNHFKIEAQNLQAEYEQHKNKHIQINVYTFESFSSISDNTETPQDRYNHYIINEADIVFFVFDGEVGGITIQEFNVAENAYKHSKDKRPQLCIFAREGAKDSVEIKYLKKRVTDLKQYWIDYKDDGDFRYKIKNELSREVDKLLYRKIKISRLFKYLLMLLCLCMLGWMIFHDASPERLETPIDVVDQLLTHGKLTVCLSDTSNVVKYNITTLEENVNWDNIDTYITDKNNVLYPKGDCFINICGYTKDLEYNEVLVYEFKFSKFIETAIRTKNVEILKHLFGYQPIEVNFPDGVCDILYDGQVCELYDYLVNYNYHIQSVTTERHAEDIFSERYPIIRLITLSK